MSENYLDDRINKETVLKFKHYNSYIQPNLKPFYSHIYLNLSIGNSCSSALLLIHVADPHFPCDTAATELNLSNESDHRDMLS